MIGRRDAIEALQATVLGAALRAAMESDAGAPLPRSRFDGAFGYQGNLRLLIQDHVHVLYAIHAEGPVVEFVGDADAVQRRLNGDEMPSFAPDAPAPQPKPAWWQRMQPTHWLLIVAALAGAPRLVPFWWGDEFYSVGFLVAPWAIWAVLRQEAQQPAPTSWRLAGFGAAILSVVAGWYLRDPTLSLWGIALALGVHALEVGTWRSSWLPVGLLAITVPPPGSTGLLLASQKAVAVLSEGALEVLGLPVTRDNFLLHGPNYSYSVEPLCTGLTGVLASVLLVGMSASHLGTSRRMALLALAIAVGGTILFNVQRIVLLVAITEVRGPSLIEGAFHEGVGLGLSLLAFAAAIPPLLHTKR